MENRQRFSIFWPLVLIAVGVVLLLNTMHILPGTVMDVLLKLWPLLLFFAGLDNIIQGHSWLWTIILLGLGTAFLLANFGIIEWGSLNLLLRLWPLLLVVWGLDLIFQERSPLTTAIGVLIGLLVIMGVVWFAVSSSPASQLVSEPFAQPLEGVASSEIWVTQPVGRMEFHGGAGPGMLLEGSVQLVAGDTLSQKYEVNSGHGSLIISTSTRRQGLFFNRFDEPRWEIKLTDEIPLGLNAETSVGRLTMDLSGLDLEEVNATVAVGALEITLDPQDEFEGRLSNPVGEIKINIPDGALVELMLDTAIAGENYPGDYVKIGDALYSPGATAENARIRLRVEKPIGLVSIDGIE